VKPRHRVPAWGAVAAALSVAVAAPRQAAAQGGADGVFLLLPVGARAVGMGQEVVAEQGGSDVLFWNPAGIAGPFRHEVAIHHSDTAVGQGNALALVYPLGDSARFGTVGTVINVLDFGEQVATDAQGFQIGLIIPTDLSYGATYAIAPSRYLALGATLKHVEFRVRCTGLCANLPTGGSSSNGADVGVQLRLPAVPLTFGLAARNLGVGQGQTRPGRIDFGADYRVRALERVAPRMEVHAVAGVVGTTALDSASFRIGSDVVLDQRIHVRAGYIRGQPYESGESIGIGLSAGKLAFDLARNFGGLTENSDKGPPTYFSLRYLW